jgi:hypothetical protein
MAQPVSALEVKIRKFDMKMIPQDAVVIFIGRRRTGKSTLVRDILFHHQDMPLGTVISGTEESNDFYKQIIPPLFIHGEYTPIIIANFCKRQKIISMKVAEEIKRVGQCRVDPRSFLIMDDCLYDNSWLTDKNIRYLFLNGRHLKVFFLITMQYPLGIPPMLRTNVDYVFILREPSSNNRKRIFDNFGSAFPSFEFFCQIMDQCTQNYECVVINNNCLSNKIEDIVFWYKANIHGEFRIGAPKFWEHSLANYKPKNYEENEEYDPTSHNRLKGPPIQVRKYPG